MHRIARIILAATPVLLVFPAACGDSADPPPVPTTQDGPAASPPPVSGSLDSTTAGSGPTTSSALLPDPVYSGTVSPGPAATAGPIPSPADHTAQHTLTFIAVGDGGATGRPVGCGDSAVPVTVTTATIAPLGELYRALLALDEQRYGASGLYNALARSDLTYQAATIADGHATIRLAGDLTMGGECDIPRVRAQLTDPALQFPNVDSVDVYINGTPLDDALSLR
ncbi:GerMN domain-containing protein [Tomitella cavernea]|uniref:GerMN domain-containing protein n=1 Tax=Tomitella cavernea TaxID=1387982 RepID=A0ABP9CIJ4_9ACTN|nr:GerMN domain-containing protein [Tomitella cavernea]